MGGAPPLESGCAKWCLGYQKAQPYHYKNTKKDKNAENWFKNHLQTFLQDFSGWFDHGEVDFEGPKSIYKENYGFQGIRTAQN